MSDVHEPSYYEIALTNRQVLAAFVLLLTCLLLAFFSGVWIGRGAATTATTAASRSTSAANAPPGKEEPPLAEFKFFTEEKERQEKSGLAPVALAPQPATTLAQDVGAPAAPASPGAPAVGPGEGATTGLPETVAAAPPVVAPKPVPRSTPTPPVIAPAARTPVAAAPAAGDLWIQVFSSPDAVQARRVLERLTTAGFQAVLSPLDRGGQIMHRVRVGPYGTRSQAQPAAEKIRKELRLETWVTNTP